MSFSVFSFVMSILTCDIFILILHMFLKKKNFVTYFHIIPVFFLLFVILLRFLVNVELPFAKVVYSDTLFPAGMDFFDFAPFLFLSPSFTIKILDIWHIVWLIGILCSLYRMFRRDIRFKRLMSKENEADERVCAMMNRIAKEKAGKIQMIKTSHVDVPMITGVVKPSIYLPDIELSDTELYHILSHEWTHYLHKDIWIKLFVKLLCVFYWWNPFFLLFKQDVDYALELRCDLSLTMKMKEEERIEYLQAILKVAKHLNEKKQVSSTTAAGVTGTQKNHPLKRRFEYILEYSMPNMKQKVGASLLMFILGFLFLGSYFFVIQPHTPETLSKNCVALVEMNSVPLDLGKEEKKNGTLSQNNEYMSTGISVKESITVDNKTVPLYCTFDSQSEALKGISDSPVIRLIQKKYGYEDISDENWTQYYDGLYRLSGEEDCSDWCNYGNDEYRKMLQFFDIYENQEKNEEIMALVNSESGLLNPEEKEWLIMLLPYDSSLELKQ